MKPTARRIDRTPIGDHLAESQAACVDDPERVREILLQRTRQLASRRQATRRATDASPVLLAAVAAERYGLDLRT